MKSAPGIEENKKREGKKEKKLKTEQERIVNERESEQCLIETLAGDSAD